MDIKELLTRYLDEEKTKTLLAEMKAEKLYISGEENIDTRYAKLKGDYELKDKQHQEASKLIEELKSGLKGNEDLQGKIGGYETQIEALRKENDALKLESALKLDLLRAGARPGDIDYLLFRVKQEGEARIDEKWALKGLNIERLKADHPGNFEEAGKKSVEVNKLADGGGKVGKVSAEQFSKMRYADRLRMKKEDNEQYEKLTKKE